MGRQKESSPKRRGGKPKLDDKALYEMIEKKAYELYEERGGEHGKEMDDWLEAERIVLGKKKGK
ncbi:MAG: DUF2934 domain-containing protein [Candidatus Dadabacteria bacterium]|nr:DUF2934 domain-containing protein [Candidatus Dadabacteria bacterium]